MAVELDFSKLSAMDVLDLAIYVENEAEDNYEELVSWMKRQGNDKAAGFFKRMAGLEELHRQQITKVRVELFGEKAPTTTNAYAWEVETPDFDSIPADVSLKAAYELAIGAETKAHDYYAGALEYATDEKMVALLENLRDAELKHKALLEKEMGAL
ncbi:MAG: ferritin family protein [bacterium]|nr:ferritin family protein [bacterium]